MNIFRRSTIVASNDNKELYSVLLSFKRVFFHLGVLSFIINLLLIMPAIYMFQVYDRVLLSRNEDTLLMLTIVVLFMYLLIGLLGWVRSEIMMRLSNNLDARMSGRVFGAAFEKSLRVGPSEASQPFYDFTNIRQFVTGNGLFTFFDAPWTPIYIIVIFMIHPLLGIFSLISALFLMGTAVVTELSSRNILAEAGRVNASASKFAALNFRNSEAIEAMGMLGNVRNHWYPKHEKFLKLQAKASGRAGVISSVTKVARLSFQSLILGLGAYLAIKNIITPGLMIGASILMGRALSPVEAAIGSWKQFISARTSYNRLKELFATFPEREEGMPLPAPSGKLTVSRLIGVPPGSMQHVLRGISFEADKGDMIAIVGPSAAGKSTLARMIVGVWKPYAGVVRLDGADVAKWNKEELGKYIGYLPQDVELLDGTIAENIARFGDIDSDMVIKAARTTGIHEMVLQLPNGYDTPIGEGGAVLSGGQKQRLALARAIYGDPVLIALDEPNSNLDEAGDSALIKALQELKQAGKTVFVITHRKTVLTAVDKIMVLANGMLQAYGPKNEVLSAIQKTRQQQKQQGVKGMIKYDEGEGVS